MSRVKYSSDPSVYLRQIHDNMMGRCYRPTHPNFQSYGAQGIDVYQPWHDFQTFKADVLALLGERPEGIRADGRSLWELDRIRSEFGYYPQNVRWLEWQKNQTNKRNRKKAVATPKRRRRTNWAALDPTLNFSLPPYISNVAGQLIVNTSYRFL